MVPEEVKNTVLPSAKWNVGLPCEKHMCDEIAQAKLHLTWQTDPKYDHCCLEQ